jgi:hypothetical protein
MAVPLAMRYFRLSTQAMPASSSITSVKVFYGFSQEITFADENYVPATLASTFAQLAAVFSFPKS